MAEGALSPPEQRDSRHAPEVASERHAEMHGVPCEGDDDPSQRLAEGLDRSLNYALSRLTLGLSPAAVAEAYFDWLVHLAAAPGKQLQLWQKALRKSLRFWHYIATCAPHQRAVLFQLIGAQGATFALGNQLLKSALVGMGQARPAGLYETLFLLSLPAVLLFPLCEQSFEFA